MLLGSAERGRPAEPSSGFSRPWQAGKVPWLVTRADAVCTVELSICFSVGPRLSRGDRVRTCGIWFWRPVLYQLSYAPMWWETTERGPLNVEFDGPLSSGEVFPLRAYTSPSLVHRFPGGTLIPQGSLARQRIGAGRVEARGAVVLDDAWEHEGYAICWWVDCTSRSVLRRVADFAGGGSRLPEEYAGSSPIWLEPSQTSVCGGVCGASTQATP